VPHLDVAHGRADEGGAGVVAPRQKAEFDAATDGADAAAVEGVEVAGAAVRCARVQFRGVANGDMVGTGADLMRSASTINTLGVRGKCSAPRGIRTPDPRLRRPGNITGSYHDSS